LMRRHEKWVSGLGNSLGNSGRRGGRSWEKKMRKKLLADPLRPFQDLVKRRL
jgi:hypothetical protein